MEVKDAPNARARGKLHPFFPLAVEEFMGSELRSEYEGTASLRLVTSPWAQREAADSGLRLRPYVARGIAGDLQG